MCQSFAITGLYTLDKYNDIVLGKLFTVSFIPCFINLVISGMCSSCLQVHFSLDNHEMNMLQGFISEKNAKVTYQYQLRKNQSFQRQLVSKRFVYVITIIEAGVHSRPPEIEFLGVI